MDKQKLKKELLMEINNLVDLEKTISYKLRNNYDCSHIGQSIDDKNRQILSLIDKLAED